MRRLESRSVTRCGGASWTWKVSSGSARTSPSFVRAWDSIRAFADALESWELSRFVSRAELDALAAELVEADVQLEHGDVDGDDAGEQDGEHDDPDDAAERTALAPPLRAAARGRWRGRGRATGGDSTCAVPAQLAISLTDLHGGAELRGRRARVGLELALRRPEGLAGQVAQDRLVAADADRELGRARAAARLLAEVTASRSDPRASGS